MTNLCNDYLPQPEVTKNIQVLLYREDSFPPGTLAYLWQKMEEENPTKFLFADGKRFTLNEFIRFFDGEKLLFLPLLVPEGEEPQLEHVVGIIWCDQIVRHRCHAHWVFWKRFWGKGRTVIACRLALSQLFALPLQPPIEILLASAHSENTYAFSLWERMGVHISPDEIPDWFIHEDGTRHAARFGYFLKSDFLASEKMRLSAEKGQASGTG